MSDSSSKVDFLAVLIYEDGPQRRCEEPRVYSASHPEIAYQAALADGNEQRYGRKFLGLSHLEEMTEEVAPIARSQGGDASELVVAKEALSAFSNLRWKGVPCDEAELAKALREPPALFELDGFGDIPWHQYTHAYGPASEVPKDIRRLISTDPAVREQALWQLSGSIYHQGSIYGATAKAVPFLLQIASDARFPERADLWQFLAEIAKSSAIHPKQIQKNWNWRRDRLGEFYAKSSDEMAAREIADVAAVRQAFVDNVETVRKRQVSHDPKIDEYAATIVRIVETPLRSEIACAHCIGSGKCYCVRNQQTDVGRCARCNGTGKCHVCHGSGNREE